jgi:hypothetical protein
LSELNFTAGYACDTTGNVILQLFVEDGVSHPPRRLLGYGCP